MYTVSWLSSVMQVGQTIDPSAGFQVWGPSLGTPRANSVISSSSKLHTVTRVPSGRYSELRQSTNIKSPLSRAMHTGPRKPVPACSGRPMVLKYFRFMKESSDGISPSQRPD